MKQTVSASSAWPWHPHRSSSFLKNFSKTFFRKHQIFHLSIWKIFIQEYNLIWFYQFYPVPLFQYMVSLFTILVFFLYCVISVITPAVIHMHLIAFVGQWFHGAGSPEEGRLLSRELRVPAFFTHIYETSAQRETKSFWSNEFLLFLSWTWHLFSYNIEINGNRDIIWKS